MFCNLPFANTREMGALGLVLLLVLPVHYFRVRREDPSRDSSQVSGGG